MTTKSNNGSMCSIESRCNGSSVKMEYKTIDIDEWYQEIEVYKCSVCGRKLSDDEVGDMIEEMSGPPNFDD